MSEYYYDGIAPVYRSQNQIKSVKINPELNEISFIDLSLNTVLKLDSQQFSNNSGQSLQFVDIYTTVTKIPATGITNYSLILTQNLSGTGALKCSTSDLNYNASTQYLNCSNINVSGTIKTDLILQRTLYFNTQIFTINSSTLLTNGTFYVSRFDSGSTIVNTIITVNLPVLPTDGSLDGFSIQFRKQRGGVTQGSINWNFVAPSSIIIPNSNTLNSGSGGTKVSDTVNSFTQRFEIFTYSGVAYYFGVDS